MKEYFIIFEGIDGVGKTSLMRELSKRYSIPVVDFYYPIDWSDEAKRIIADFTYKFLESALPAFKTCFVDRFFGSEYVYSEKFKRRSDPDYIFSVEEALSRNSYVKFCNVVVFTHRELDNRDIEAEKLYWRYVHKTRLPTLCIFNDDFDEAVEEIAKWLKEIGVDVDERKKLFELC